MPQLGDKSKEEKVGRGTWFTALVRGEPNRDLICVYFYFFPSFFPLPEGVLELDCPSLSPGPRHLVSV